MSLALGQRQKCLRPAMSGFSLLEMALALVILSLMMGWLMTPLRVQHGLQK